MGWRGKIALFCLILAMGIFGFNKIKNTPLIVEDSDLKNRAFVKNNFKQSNESVLHEKEQIKPDSVDKAKTLEELQQEIKLISDNDVETELLRLKTYMYEKDLINRLNADQVSEEERRSAQEVFDRVAVLGIEKAERKLAKMVPDMEKDLARSKEEFKRIKEMLAAD